jgi:hypothetical protein
MGPSTMSRSSSCPAALTTVRKGQRKCGSCGAAGHNARTCTQKTLNSAVKEQPIHDQCLPCSVVTVEQPEPKKRKERKERKERICGNCGSTGHNVRTCVNPSVPKEQKSPTTRDYHKALPRFVGFTGDGPKKTSEQPTALEGLNKTFFLTLEDPTYQKQVRMCRACGLTGHNARTCAVHQAFLTMGIIC